MAASDNGVLLCFTDVSQFRSFAWFKEKRTDKGWGRATVEYDLPEHRYKNVACV